MKNLLCTLLCSTLLLAGCSKDLAEHTPAGNSENDAALFLAPQHFYGTAYSDLVTKGVAQADKLWPAGATITVKFLNDDFNMAAQVEEWAKEWEQYANITFDFVDPSQQADVRIGFDWNDNRWITWSYIGTDCLSNTDQGDATISYAFWDTATPEEIKGDVLRTFGQVLGLELEHRHLDFNPGWVSEAQVRKFWTNDIEDIPWSDLQKYVYTPLEQAGTLQSENYDPQSIMIWPFGAQYAAYTQRYFNYELSDTDKAFIATLYPEEIKEEGLVFLLRTYYSIDFTILSASQVVIDWDNGRLDTLPAGDHNPYIPYDEWERLKTIRVYGTDDAVLELGFGHHNSFEEIEIIDCRQMQTLYLWDNYPSLVDLSGAPHLKTLSIDGTSITELDLRKNLALEILNINFNFQLERLLLADSYLQMTELNLGSGGSLPEPYLQHFPNLKTLSLGIDYFTSLDLSVCPLLENFGIGQSTLISTLDFSMNPELKNVSLSFNDNIRSIDFSMNPKLEQFSYVGSGLESMDFTRNPLLKRLSLANYTYEVFNPGPLDVSQNPLLEIVDIDNANIESLSFTHHPHLKQLTCRTNFLRELNLSGCTGLESLNCYNNLLTQLDLSTCTALRSLDCQNNRIEALNLAFNPELQTLYCNGNQIAALNITANPKLVYLYCQNNAISGIDASANPLLNYLYCENNPIVTDQAALVAMAQSLPNRTSLYRGTLSISNTTSAGWISDICSGKNWFIN